MSIAPVKTPKLQVGEMMWSMGDQLRVLNNEEIKRPIHWLTELTDQYGISYYALFRDLNIESRLDDSVILSNWPPGILVHLEPVDAQILKGLTTAIGESLTPFVWNAADSLGVATDDRVQSAADLVGNSRLLTGLVVPVISPNGSPHAAVLGGLNKIISQQALKTFQYSITKIFEQIWADTYYVENSLFSNLRNGVSAREKDCLHWASHGKTSTEIGIVLGLSEHTVNRYFESAINKLKAKNRTHAVAIALKRNLI